MRVSSRWSVLPLGFLVACGAQDLGDPSGPGPGGDYEGIDEAGQALTDLSAQCTFTSGTGVMETMVVNALSPGDRVLAVSIGAFGDRFGKIADRLQHRLPSDRVVDRAAWWTDKFQNRYEDICRRLRCQSGQVELTKRFGWSETLEVTNNAQQSASCGAG